MNHSDYLYLVGVIFVAQNFDRRMNWLFGGIALVLSVVTRYV